MSTHARSGENQGLWSQNGDTMSPGLGGVFWLLKEVTFRIILTFYNVRKWGLFAQSGYHDL